MKIIVTIKQVPFIDQLKFDKESRRLLREGVESEINPFDKRALTRAIELRNEHGGEVIVITMGPPQARDALVEALAMGADRAVHLLGREFAGADTLATARALALACRKIEYDLVMCGKYSTDAETAQVPPMLAELLDIPQITSVTKVELQRGENQLTATRELDDGFETVQVSLPALLSATERLVKPIKVKPADLEQGKNKPIEVVTAGDLTSDAGILGLAGSPTWVEEIYSVKPTRKRKMWSAGENVKGVADEIVKELLDEGLFGEWKTRLRETIRPRRLAGTNNQIIRTFIDKKYGLVIDDRMLEEVKSQIGKSVRRGENYTVEVRGIARTTESPRTVQVSCNEILSSYGGKQEIWVVAEIVHEQIRPVTLELLGRSIQLADKLDGQVAAVLIGDRTAKHIRTLTSFGADEVYVANAPQFATYSTDAYTTAVADAILRYDPFAVLFPSTTNGRDLAPRVAARLGAGLTGDCIGLEIDEEGRLVQLKPAFGGTIIAPILSRTRPALATVRPGIFTPAEPDYGREPVITSLPVAVLPPGRVRTIGTERNVAVGVDIESADIVIGIGTGIGGPENLPLVRELANVLSAPIGCTRKVVDLGWMPSQVQIGLTGRTISPQLYIAIGVGGKFNHTVGIQRAGLVLAIDRNPDAEIFQHADYGIVGDWTLVVPALVLALGSAAKTNH